MQLLLLLLLLLRTHSKQRMAPDSGRGLSLSLSLTFSLCQFLEQFRRDVKIWNEIYTHNHTMEFEIQQQYYLERRLIQAHYRNVHHITKQYQTLSLSLSDQHSSFISLLFESNIQIYAMHMSVCARIWNLNGWIFMKLQIIVVWLC